MVLSIPLWCDWDGASLTVSLAGVSAFNPTVVRLGLEIAAMEVSE